MKLDTDFLKENLPFSLEATTDATGAWYIGYNYRFNVYNGLVWTQKMADAQLLQDAERHKFAIYKHVLNSSNFNHKTISALVSIILAVGFEKLYTDKFFETVSNGNKVAIHQAFLSYSRTHRAVCVKALEKRKKEYIMFIGDK
jgi:GH24 family phage-related lysozyme (muramidase)